MVSGTAEQANQLRALHIPGTPLVLVNVWDIASAQVVAALPGTLALATASWSVSAALGVADGGQLPLDHVLDLARRIVAVTSLPVSVDFEKGYATDLQTLGENIRRLSQTGVAGLNIEDSIAADDGPCWSITEAAKRVAAVRAAAEAEGIPLVINARTDVLAGGGRSVEAIARGNAYLEAGADCAFVLGAIGPELRSMVSGIRGPVSVLAGAGALPIAELAAAGVARISVGPGSMGVAYAALHDLVRDLHAGDDWPPALAFRPGRP